MRKVKRILQSKESEIPVVGSGNVEVQIRNDVEEIREEAKSATRQATEAKEDLDDLRAELLKVRKMSESAHRLAKKTRKQSQSHSISNVGVGGDSISEDLVHDVHCLKYEVKKLKSKMKD
jgi:hypothetical protein